MCKPIIYLLIYFLILILTTEPLCLVHTMPEKFQNDDYTLKTHQMFSVHTTPEMTQQSPVILDLCWRKTRGRKSYHYRDISVFEKFRFKNVFRPH